MTIELTPYETNKYKISQRMHRPLSLGLSVSLVARALELWKGVVECHSTGLGDGQEVD